MYSYAHLILFEQMVPFFFSLNRTKYFITRGKLFGPKKRLRPRLQFRQNVNCLLMESRTREQILTVTQLRTFCCSRGWTLPLKSQPQYRQAEVNTNYSLWRDLLQSPPSGPNLWCKHILMAQSDPQWSKFAQEQPTRNACNRSCTRGLAVGWVHLQRCSDLLSAHVGDQEAETSAMPRNEVGSHQGCEGRSGR